MERQISKNKKNLLGLRLIVLILLSVVLLFTSCSAPKNSETQVGNTTQENITLVPYKEGDKWGYVDENKNIVIKPMYEEAYDFHEGLARVKVNGKYGYIDTKGNMVIDAIYDKAGDFHDGFAPVEVSGNGGYVDKKGTLYWEN